MLISTPAWHTGRVLGIVLLLGAVVACGGTSTSTAATGSAGPKASSAATLAATTNGATATIPGLASAGASSSATAPQASAATPTDAIPSNPGQSGSPEPDATGGTTTGGDIPDNAVFLTYDDAAHGFSIQYVEGWQVGSTADGVAITDKDSSETIQVMPATADVKGYISSTDLPALQATDGFNLLTQDTVKIHGKAVDHLQYKQLSPPDPVTNKRLPSLVDRYYYPGPNGLAVLTMSTPKDVDNVDAFKQLAESFTWK